MKKWVLVIILTLGVVVRLRNFWLLPIDAHPMRQTDTECVAYFLARDKADILYPKTCLIRPVSNTEGLFYLEFPAYEGLLALGYKIFGVNMAVVRIINLGLYLLASVGLYLLVGSLGVVFLFSMAPGSIFFIGHAIHPDVFAVTMILWGLVMIKNKKTWWGGLMLGLSVATRPFGLIAWPMVVWLMKKNRSRMSDYLIVGILAVGFYGWWRWWTLRVGVDASWENWVLAGWEKIFDWGILKNLIFKNVVGEIVGRMISLLTVLGLIIAGYKKHQQVIPYLGWLLMVPIYWLLVFDGNLTHQYYANVYLVPVVVVAGYGLGWLWEKCWLIGALVALVVVANGWRTSGYYFANKVLPEKLEFAKEIRDNIPTDGRVLYLVKSDSLPISLAHRQGWMLGEWPTDVAPHIWSIMEMRNLGIEYLVEPKGSMDMKREDMVVVEENFPLWRETKNLKIFRWQKR